MLTQAKFNPLIAAIVPIGMSVVNPVFGAYTYRAANYRVANKEAHRLGEHSESYLSATPSLLLEKNTLDVSLGSHSLELVAANNEHIISEPVLLPLDISQGSHTEELAIIDKGVANYSALLAGLKEHVDVRFIEQGGSGLVQLDTLLAQYSGLKAIHLISHAGNGFITLAGEQIKLDKFNDTLQKKAFKAALQAGGEILLYGCELAKSAEPQLVLEQLSLDTGLVIAASDDLTGHLSKGGDWELEIQTRRYRCNPIV